jgi:hypothetical protein
VRRAHSPEVPVVKGRDPSDLQAFGNSDNRRIGRTQWKVGVRADQVRHALQV